jgi:hypothetical protein
VLKRVVLGFLIVGQVRGRIPARQFFGSALSGHLGGAALGLVRDEFVGGVEVAAASVAAELIGVRTGWSRHGTRKTRHPSERFGAAGDTRGYLALR